MEFKVFLINLDRSEERLQQCEKEFAKLGIEFERVSAIYGKSLSAHEVSQWYDDDANIRKYKKPLSLGEVGCYLSHIKCWQKIVDEKLDYAIILEDDFVLSDSFNEYKTLLAKLKNWDFIRLAFSSKNIPIAERQFITAKHDLVYFCKVPIDTLAQAVSNQGAKKLLTNSKSFCRPVDVDIKHYWEKNITILGIDPPLISARQDFRSIISAMSSGQGRELKTNIFRNLKYLTCYKIKMFYFNRLRPKLSSFIK